MLFSQGIAVQAQVPAAEPDAGPSTNALIANSAPKEDWDTSKQTSGATVRAIRVISRAHELGMYPTAWVPMRLASKELCYRVWADQGRYDGYLELNVAEDWTGGAAAVIYETKFSKPPWSIYPDPRTGVFGRLLLGNCDAFSMKKRYLPSNWKTVFSSAPSGLEIYLHDQHNYALKALLEGSEPSPCNKTPTERGDYSHVCTVPLDWAAEDEHQAQEIRIEIIRTQTVRGNNGQVVMDPLRSDVIWVVLN